jgi:hypothetical protein
MLAKNKLFTDLIKLECFTKSLAKQLTILRLASNKSLLRTNSVWYSRYARVFVKQTNLSKMAHLKKLAQNNLFCKLKRLPKGLPKQASQNMTKLKIDAQDKL